MHGAYAKYGINTLVSITDAAVRGTITAIGEPRWNSPDGAAWTPEAGDTATPYIYREVEIDVSDVVFATGDIAVAPGDRLTFRSLGDGTATGEDVFTFRDGTVLRKNNIDGRIEKGLDVLLLLSRSELPLQGNDVETVNQIVGNYQGNWSIQEDRAVSIDPKRTLKLPKLLKLIDDERAAGKNPSRDAGTLDDPAGSTDQATTDLSESTTTTVADTSVSSG